MKRVMLTVAYDGTNYHGWQVQANGETIEGILNRCLSELLGEDVAVIGQAVQIPAFVRWAMLRYLIRTVPFRRIRFPMR